MKAKGPNGAIVTEQEVIPKPQWSQIFTITDSEQTAFRQLSGDNNPLHYSTEFANQRGFTGPVVYGGLIVAKISGFIGSTFPGDGCVWSKLTVNFRAPLYVGVEAHLSIVCTHANEDLGVWELAVKLNSPDKLLATASVQVMLPKTR